MKIQVNINGQFVEIDLDKCAIKSVSKDKYQSVDLCVEIEPDGFLIPFAQIKLYDDGRFVSAKETFQDAINLGDYLAQAVNQDIGNQHTKKLFAAIVDNKLITHNSGLKVRIPTEGNACLILHNDDDYSRPLSFIDVLNRANQFIIED